METQVATSLINTTLNNGPTVGLVIIAMFFAFRGIQKELGYIRETISRLQEQHHMETNNIWKEIDRHRDLIHKVETKASVIAGRCTNCPASISDGSREGGL